MKMPMINSVILNTLHIIVYGKSWELGTKCSTLSTKVKYPEYISRLNKQNKAKNSNLGRMTKRVFN